MSGQPPSTFGYCLQITAVHDSHTHLGIWCLLSEKWILLMHQHEGHSPDLRSTYKLLSWCMIQPSTTSRTELIWLTDCQSISKRRFGSPKLSSSNTFLPHTTPFWSRLTYTMKGASRMGYDRIQFPTKKAWLGPCESGWRFWKPRRHYIQFSSSTPKNKLRFIQRKLYVTTE